MVINYVLSSKGFPDFTHHNKDKVKENATFRESKGETVQIVENKRNESNLIYQTPLNK